MFTMGTSKIRTKTFFYEKAFLKKTKKKVLMVWARFKKSSEKKQKLVLKAKSLQITPFAKTTS